MTLLQNRTVLVLQHQDDDGPGNLGTWLDDNEIDWTLVDVAAGDLPEPGRYRAVVVLGSRESAYDVSVSWLVDEQNFVRACVEEGTPVLGICFGAQLLSLVLGGEVLRMDHPELGWFDVGGTPPFAGSWFLWHQDEIRVPPGSTVVARTDRCVHTFLNGPHVGVQYHPELTPEHIGEWLRESERRIKIDAAGGDLESMEADTQILGARAVSAAASLYETFLFGSDLANSTPAGRHASNSQT